MLATTLMLLDGMTDNAQVSDVGIVLGSKVNPDGTLSNRLQARLDKAVALYRQNTFPHIIVSGGLGIEGYDEAVTMKNYLVTQGIPSDAISTDSHGDTTMATAKNSAAIMQAHGWRSAVVITQYFHITRSRMILHAYGIAPVTTAHPMFFEARDLYSIPREVVACLAYLPTLLHGR